MPKIDAYEEEILSAYEEGELKSVATKDWLAKFKAAARATAIEDRRVNIRLSAEEALRMAAAVKLFELGRLSSGAAAHLAGIPRVVFLSRLADYGVDTFRLSTEDLQGETRLTYSPEDETAYLLRSPVNRERLLRALENAAQDQNLEVVNLGDPLQGRSS